MTKQVLSGVNVFKRHRERCSQMAEGKKEPCSLDVARKNDTIEKLCQQDDKSNSGTVCMKR